MTAAFSHAEDHPHYWLTSFFPTDVCSVSLSHTFPSCKNSFARKFGGPDWTMSQVATVDWSLSLRLELGALTQNKR